MGVVETKRGVEINLFISIQVGGGVGAGAISITPYPPFYGLANITRTVTNEFIKEHTHKYGKEKYLFRTGFLKILYITQSTFLLEIAHILVCGLRCN